MKTKLISMSIIIMLALSNAIILFSIHSKANVPIWPDSDSDPDTNWFLSDENDPLEKPNQDYRDVNNSYYYINGNYLYFRLECYGYPNFTTHPDARYKWFIDIDDPHDLYGSGNTIYQAEYLLFAEDSPKPHGDGIIDIYLLNDIENDGFPTGSKYLTDPGNITDPNLVGCRIEGHYVDLYVNRTLIGDPQHAYFTWATDQGDPNLDSSNGEISEFFFNETIAKSDIGIIKSDRDETLYPIYAGESFTYTLNVTNHGPHNASYLNVTDELPSNLVLNNSSHNYTIGPNNTFYWHIENFIVGQSIYITLNVTADNITTGYITNYASAFNGKYDTASQNNYDDETTNILKISDLSIKKYSSADTVLPKEVFTYTIELTNNGPTEAENVSVTDKLPYNVTYIIADPEPDNISDSIYTWDLGSLLEGSHEYINITVQVKNIASTILTNIANVTSDSYDKKPLNNTAIQYTVVGSVADLSIEKSDSADTVYYNEIFTYTLNITNNGPDVAQNVTLTDILPKEVSFLSSNEPPYEIIDSNYTWTFPFIAIGETKTITIKVLVETTNIGTITNHAHVTSDTIDSSLANNNISENTYVDYSAELSVIKTCDTETAIAGDNLTYTINVTNHGPHTAYNITVTDTLPAEVSFVSSNPTPSQNTSQIYQWNITSLEAYYSYIITLNVTINNGTVGIISNQVNVTSVTHDINDEDDNDTENTTVKGVADISIQKTADAKNPIYAGDKITYILNVTNYGPDPALIVNITDILPQGVTFTNSNIAPNGSNNSKYYWIIPSINVNDSVIIKINVTINKDFSGVITNIANITEDSYDPVDENNQVELKITVSKKYTPPGGGGGTPSTNGDEFIDEQPTAIINGPYFGTPNEEIQFDAKESHDNDEDGQSIVRFDWKFSDDQEWQEDLGDTPIYIYTQPGVYTVTLKVIDDENNSGINTTTVTIINPNIPPKIPEIDGPNNGTINISYNFTVVSTDEDGDELKYTIEWGDGTSNESEFLPSGEPYNISHKYAATGNYTISVTANDGSTVSANETTIHITEPPKLKQKGFDYTLLLLLLLLFLILLLILILAKRRKDKKEQQKPKSS